MTTGDSSSSVEDKQDIQEVLADMDRTDKQVGIGSGNLNTATSKSFMSHAGGCLLLSVVTV